MVFLQTKRTNYTNGGCPDRAAASGYRKATGTDKPILNCLYWDKMSWSEESISISLRLLSRPKTHSKGMTVISHFKYEGLQCNLAQTIIL